MWTLARVVSNGCVSWNFTCFLSAKKFTKNQQLLRRKFRKSGALKLSFVTFTILIALFLADFFSDFLLKVLGKGKDLVVARRKQHACLDVSRVFTDFFFCNSAEIFQAVINIVISNSYLTVAVHLTVHVFFPAFVHGWKSRFLPVCCLLSQ